ncbi:protein kinase [Candidatus Woesearchaeota archaeon]|nr:protein kinase [Candidatus Woesearchaeota archaeon]
MGRTSYATTRFDERQAKTLESEITDKEGFLKSEDPVARAIKIIKPLGAGGQSLAYVGRLIYSRLDEQGWRQLYAPILAHQYLLNNSNNIDHWEAHYENASSAVIGYSKTDLQNRVKQFYRDHQLIGKNGRVAVTVSRLATNDKNMLERLSRQRKLAGLPHPNLAYLFATGTLKDKRSYSVVQLLQGALSPSKTYGWPLQKHIEALKQMIKGMNKLKEYGVLHRDLKPENIFYKENGHGPQFKIADYGLMKQILGRSTIETEDGGVFGTAGFMSPEQVRDLHTCDWRSDQFSLGASVYEMITKKSVLGIPETDTRDVELLLRNTLERPLIDSILTEQDKMKERFELVLARMMQKLQTQRYDDYDEILQDLEDIQKGKKPKNTNDSYRAKVFKPSEFSTPTIVKKIKRLFGGFCFF